MYITYLNFYQFLLNEKGQKRLIGLIRRLDAYLPKTASHQRTLSIKPFNFRFS